MTEAPKTPSPSSDARRTVRVAMQEYMRRDSVLPVLRMLLDLAFLGACIAGACYFNAWWAALMVACVIAIARLFVIGRDACHSYTKT
jgi:fatty acid desaturase